MYINTDIGLPKKGRKASTDLKLFLSVLDKAIVDEDTTPEDVIGKVIESEKLSISFDLENVDLFRRSWSSPERVAAFDDWDRSTRFTGWKSLIYPIEIDGKKVPVIMGYAGGDWEQPVAYILYLSAKGQLRVYVPRKGNVFNNITNEAFGNDEEKDEKYCTIHKIDYDELCDGKAEFHDESLFMDICARLEPVEPEPEETEEEEDPGLDPSMPLPPELSKIITVMGGGAKAHSVKDIEKFFGARELSMEEKKELVKKIEELKPEDINKFFNDLSLAELRVAAKYLYKTRRK